MKLSREFQAPIVKKCFSSTLKENIKYQPAYNQVSNLACLPMCVFNSREADLKSKAPVNSRVKCEKMSERERGDGGRFERRTLECQCVESM